MNAGGGEGAPSAPVRAVTKPEPLPPIGLRVVERRLGSNGWRGSPTSSPTSRSTACCRCARAKTPRIVASVPPTPVARATPSVGAARPVTYTLVAFDRDGLESRPSEAVHVTSEGYALRPTPEPDGVHLSWNPRTEEGFRGARILRAGGLTRRELPDRSPATSSTGTSKPGRSYRYIVDPRNARTRARRRAPGPSKSGSRGKRDCH